MKKVTKYTDRQVREAFDELVSMASCSHLLGEIAKHPKRRREETIEGFFRTILRAKLKGEVNVLLSQREEDYGPKHDIVGERNSRTAIAIEIKTPSTDRGGIPHKTEREHGLPKDMKALAAAKADGVPRTYELVALFGCYAVNKKGKRIQASNTELREKYGIEYPTERDYFHREGEGKVHDAIKRLSKDNGLEAKRIKGWKRVKLPSSHSNIYTFIDCALYKVQPK